MSKSEIDAMNARMDSFVDQITEIKNNQDVILSLQKDINTVNRQKKSLDFISRSVEVLQNRFDIIERNQMQVSNIIAEHEDTMKLFSNLSMHVSEIRNDVIHTNGSNNDIHKRLKNIESFLQKFNFEKITEELTKLNKEYHDKAQKIISGIISSVSSSQQTYDKDLLFKEFADFPISGRIQNVLRGNNIKFFGDLVCHPNKRLGYLRREYHFGKSSFDELMNFLNSFGLKKNFICDEYWKDRKLLTGVDYNQVWN